MKMDRIDRELVLGFVMICMALLVAAVVAGLALRAFILAAGL